MKRGIIQFVSILLCFILQSTLIKYAALAGICPNIMIILPAVFGFLGGQRDGIIGGFFTGFIFDLFYCDVLGLNALVFMLLGFFAGFFNEHYNKDEVAIPLMLVMVGDLFYGFMNYVFHFLLRNRLDLSYYMNNIIIPEIVYTLFVTIFLYKFILFVHKLINKQKERKVTRYVF